jgi:hypothetical protein
MPPEIIQKITKLRKYWYDDDSSLKWVESVEKRLRNAIDAGELSKNKSVLPIIADANDRIKVINLLLVNDEKMTDDIRKLLLRERSVHKFWLNRFSAEHTDTKIETINSLLDEELKKIQ